MEVFYYLSAKAFPDPNTIWGFLIYNKQAHGFTVGLKYNYANFSSETGTFTNPAAYGATEYSSVKKTIFSPSM